MTQKNPNSRLTVAEYSNILKGMTSLETTEHPVIPPFPTYFESCLYPLFLKLHWEGVTPDDRVWIVCQVRIQI